MKDILDFDDAGANNDEPVKGVTVGDIRAWHDCMEKTREMASQPLKEHEAENKRLTIAYDNMLTTWADCRALLKTERETTFKLIAGLREIEKFGIVVQNAARATIADVEASSSAPSGCNHWPGQKRSGVCGMGDKSEIPSGLATLRA